MLISVFIRVSTGTKIVNIDQETSQLQSGKVACFFTARGVYSTCRREFLNGGEMLRVGERQAWSVTALSVSHDVEATKLLHTSFVARGRKERGGVQWVHVPQV